MTAGRSRNRYRLLAMAALTLIVVSCGSDSSESSPSAPATEGSAASVGSAVCGYLYEWADTFRFPLQPDPHAAYTYVVPKITDQRAAYEITGQFPYGSWTEWMVYTGAQQGVVPYSVVKDSDITPDEGSVNPFVPGNLVLSGDRDYRLLILPDGTDQSSVHQSLQDVPASNVLTSPTDGDVFILANRVYDAFPGYNPGGAGGPTDTPFAQVKAIDWQTGADLDCSDLNAIPNPKSPTDMPTGRTPISSPIALEGGARFAAGPHGSSGDDGTAGFEYAPALDPDLIEFTRPPLLPGADVSSIPPSDACAGYLGAATSPTEIGLIRMPHVATWFDTSDLTDTSVFSQEETTYISFTLYGDAVGSYQPGSPDTASLGNAELLPDASGGSTIVVWPRSLTPEQQQQVFDHANRNGWALIRGDEAGKETTANLLVRLKGDDPSYPGGYTPTSDRSGVPCFFDDNPDSTSWADVVGDEYVASAQNLGPGAPQGVNCTLEEFLGDACETELRTNITDTGGAYEVSPAS